MAVIITIFDTETTGFPKAGAPLADQPALLQLAAVSYVQDAQGGLRPVGHFSMLIKDDPVGRTGRKAECDAPIGAACKSDRMLYPECTCPRDAAKLTPRNNDCAAFRLSLRLAERAGGPASTALWHFSMMCARSDRVLAYNAAFDAEILSIALQRCDYPGLEGLFDPEKLHCLMLSAAPIVRVPPKRSGERYGWPKLSESYQHFTARELRGAHDAMVDVRGAAAVYSGLLKAGAEIVKAPFESPRSRAASG